MSDLRNISIESGEYDNFENVVHHLVSKACNVCELCARNATQRSDVGDFLRHCSGEWYGF